MCYPIKTPVIQAKEQKDATKSTRKNNYLFYLKIDKTIYNRRNACNGNIEIKIIESASDLKIFLKTFHQQ